MDLQAAASYPPDNRRRAAAVPGALPNRTGSESPPNCHRVPIESRGMKLATWNVNSIRARHPRLLAWLAHTAPDVVCLQETKVEDAGFPFDTLAEVGYHAVTLGQRSYNGVAILSREPATDVALGLDDGDPDDQARVIAATVRGVRVISVYVPNGQEVGSDKYEYKLAWLARLRGHLERRYAPAELLAVCGDMNVAPLDLDVYDPAAWRDSVLCSEAERDGLRRVMGWGLTDVFRAHHADGGHYSWWDYRGVALFKNQGLRIDHIFATPALAARCTSCEIDRATRKGANASDHAPVIAEFALE
jgi:exodeoxyribonuclease III